MAQMVERALSMREVPGSMPGASTFFFHFFNLISPLLIIAFSLSLITSLC